MKKVYIGLMAIVVLIGCTDQSKELSLASNTNDVTSSIDKLEYSYVDGNSKIETDSTDSTVKKEFQAPSRYLATIKHLSEDRNGSKKSVMAVSSLVGTRVGVIADYVTSTGGYDVLEIHMDCEDSNPNNVKSGWIGANTVDKNVTLKLCLVPKSLFSSYKYAQYAVLSLDYGYQNMIERKFDNEDSGTQNWTNLNGTRLSSDAIYNQLGNGIQQDINTTLCFLVYDQNTETGMESFPDLGISYGVFGSTAENRSKGYIITDDEDSNNANQCWYNWNNLSNPENSSWRDHIGGIIEPGINTKIHIFKAR